MQLHISTVNLTIKRYMVTKDHMVMPTIFLRLKKALYFSSLIV